MVLVPMAALAILVTIYVGGPERALDVLPVEVNLVGRVGADRDADGLSALGPDAADTADRRAVAHTHAVGPRAAGARFARGRGRRLLLRGGGGLGGRRGGGRWGLLVTRGRALGWRGLGPQDEEGAEGDQDGEGQEEDALDG